MGKASYGDDERRVIIEHVLGEVAGGRALDRVLRDDEGMPDPATFWRWHLADDILRDNLARARENGVERLMDECVGIADDATNDFMDRKREDGSEDRVLDHEHVQRSKLRIETRLKYAQMIAPRKYGAKVDVTSGGDKLDFAALLAERRAKAAGSED